MEMVAQNALENWVLSHAEAGQKKLYFTINGDIPLASTGGNELYYQIPHNGKLVCVLHPNHLTRVAQICYAAGVQMVQVLL